VDSGSAQEVHQNRLDLVVGRMADSHNAGAPLPGGADQEAIADDPGGFLDRMPARPQARGRHSLDDGR